MAETPGDGGIVDYLVYAVVGLASTLLAAVQRHFGGRLKRVEEATEANKRDMERKFEARRLETKEDFRLLHNKVEAGHAEILREIRKVGHGGA